MFPIGRKAAEILEEYEPKLDPARQARAARAARPTRARRPGPVAPAGPGAAPAEVDEALAPLPAGFDAEVTAYERRVAETIVRPSARPVLVVRNNKVTTEFLGPDSETWAGRIDAARAVLDVVIPAIGRVELKNNADFNWVGTGWLVADDIIVTNRHVAREFGRKSERGFVFRTGVNGGPQLANVDFLEEFGRSSSAEFQVESILWIATPTEPDIAYLRVKRPAARGSLAAPIRLAETVAPDDMVVTIGYPARDPRVPDQRLVARIFGDVYEKKRLAPGQITEVGPDELQHDCSTLGGNSGSPVIRLQTGEAVGLHFSGLFLEANFAVPATKVRDLLARVQRGDLPGMGPIELRSPASAATASPASGAASSTSAAGIASGGGVYSFQFQIPVEITVKVGGIVVASGSSPIAVTPVAGAPGDPASIEAAVAATRRRWPAAPR